MEAIQSSFSVDSEEASAPRRACFSAIQFVSYRNFKAGSLTLPWATNTGLRYKIRQTNTSKSAEWIDFVSTAPPAADRHCWCMKRRA